MITFLQERKRFLLQNVIELVATGTTGSHAMRAELQVKVVTSRIIRPPSARTRYSHVDAIM